jgi:hypothetical protein
MLRGVTGLIVPVTGTLVFDILRSDSLRAVKDASGGMMPADWMAARDQVLAGPGGRCSGRELVAAGSHPLHLLHSSQSVSLRPDQ